MSKALTVTAGDAPAPTKAALVTGGSIRAMVPQDVEQAWRMAEMIHRAGIAPRDMQSPDKIVTSIFAGMEIGLPPMQAVQSIAVVNGRPTIWGDAALGLVQASGLLEAFKERITGEGDGMVAQCVAKRRDNPELISAEFSVTDAKTAGLWNKSGPWKQYPKRMLAMRARAFALRNGFADVLKGLGVREEVGDFDAPNSKQAATAQTPNSIENQLRQQAQTSWAPDAGEDGGPATPAAVEQPGNDGSHNTPDTPAVSEPKAIRLVMPTGEPEEHASAGGWLASLTEHIADLDPKDVRALMELNAETFDKIEAAAKGRQNEDVLYACDDARHAFYEKTKEGELI
ncbi:MAG: recombinase RecT [Alphaproteobacteria bacterium]|nr:recombinase RecT [Alphaproteobacteria bacterium]